MNPFVTLSVQCTMSLLIFFFVAQWYLVPQIRKDNKVQILAFLLLINVFRYLPLSLFMPGQVSVNFPHYLKQMVAYGDFTSALLALLALILLKKGNKSANAFVWLFSFISVVDLVTVLILAIKEKVYELPLGANYFTVSVYVPLLIITQFYLLKLLTNKAYQ